MISVVVVDDEQLVRSGFAALLDSDPEITVVGTAGDGDAALAMVRRERPDVVLMDIRMPGRDGVSATAAITADPTLSETRVIVLTTFDLDEYVHAALRAGASGFLLKDAQPTDQLFIWLTRESPCSHRLWSDGSSPLMFRLRPPRRSQHGWTR
jgi:DNA-binding NarL/FixJ family response regulator